MGYRISSLNNLPSNLECYYFLIGDYSFDSTVNNLFRNSFRSLADALGENIAIIEKTNNGKLERDLLNTLYTNPNLMETIEKWERNTPGLLIMWCHPSNLTDNESLVYIPFLTLADVYDTNVNALFADLVSYAKYENTNLIDKIKDKHRIIKGVSLSVNLGIFAINIDL